MVIDTRRCVGCEACVIACEFENQTPPGVHYTVVAREPLPGTEDDRPAFMTKPCFHCYEPPHGSTTAILETTRGIHPEVVGAQHGFGHWALGRVAKGRGSAFGNLNTLRYDPLSGQASHKEICVRVRPA
jgi:ferredoxin